MVLGDQEKDLGTTEAMDQEEAKSVIRNEFRIPKDWKIKAKEVTE